MSDEIAMTIIENLTEELGDKELKIMELEKKIKRLKKLMEKKDIQMGKYAERLEEAEFFIDNRDLGEDYDEVLRQEGHSPR